MGRVQFWQSARAGSRCSKPTRCIPQHLGRLWILIQFGRRVLAGCFGIPTPPDSVPRAGKSRTLTSCDKPARDGYGRGRRSPVNSISTRTQIEADSQEDIAVRTYINTVALVCFHSLVLVVWTLPGFS